MRYFSITLVLALFLPGCDAAPATPAQALPTSTTVLIEPTALPTEAAASPSPEVALDEVAIAFEENGIQLAFDPSMTSELTAETIPASSATAEGMPPEGIYPAYRQLTLDGYPAEYTRNKPQLFVYPVEEFAALNPSAAETIAQLQQLLAEEPATPNTIPLLPLFNAAQVIRAQVEYLPFQNGRGVRFLTQYDQSPYPIHNRALFYTFQGLTDDGAYYVAAILPISASFLSDSADSEQLDPDQGFPSLDSEAFGEALTTYFGTITQTLNNTSSSDFTPTLTLLDAMVQSIAISPPTE
ncbi:MAG: hypothetical protein H0T73_11615 [Ardenticatenales bacterium]|nr:hypothetical protein [Ardenticatenales bacterium]